MSGITVTGIWEHVAVQVNDRLATIATAAPDVDEAEVRELATDLDDAVAATLDRAGIGSADEPVQLTKTRLAQLERCERSALAALGPSDAGPPGTAAVLGRAVDHFVAQVVVGGRIGEPGPDLRAALAAHGDHEALACLDDLDAGADADAARSADRIAAAAGSARDAWSGLDPDWVARTQSPAAAFLAGDRLRVAGTVDVELGGPHTGRPGVVVEVKSGRPADPHRHESYFYGLVVTLRDRAAPAAVATWYPGAPLAVLRLTRGTLDAAAARLLAGLRQWLELLDGRPSSTTPGPWCRWCPVRDVCDDAEPVHLADPATSTVPW